MISLGSGFPILCTYDREAYLAFLVNIRVINLCFEAYLRWLEWIFSWKINLNAKSPFVVWWIVLKSQTTVHLYLCAKPHFSVICIIHKLKLTGTIKPCQVRIFDSSTWISLKDFSPDCLISFSSWNYKNSNVNIDFNLRLHIHCFFLGDFGVLDYF